MFYSLNRSGGPIGVGSQRTFWALGDYKAVSVAGLGNGKDDWDSLEVIDGEKENIRIAAAGKLTDSIHTLDFHSKMSKFTLSIFCFFSILIRPINIAGASALLANKITAIDVEDLGCARSAAEGVFLSSYKHQDLRAKEKRKPEAILKFVDGGNDSSSWEYGRRLAENQNWARYLSNTAANLMTPTIFAENVRINMPKSVDVIAHDKAWALQQKMGSYLSVAQGSDQPPIFLELTYNGTGGSVDGKQPICLVGKGITFDSGGISLKPPAKMDAMRGDMTGAAVVVATFKALAESQANVYVKGFVPLTENLPSGSATKPGDVVTARNGKTICVDNTDAEGRLVLVDAIDYAKDFNPKFILDIATLTGACSVALGMS